MEIKPQKGFQEEALATTADIAIIGGAAGAGKTWVLLMESLKHFQNKKFSGVYFRRTMANIRATGGLWDESSLWYPLFGAKPSESILKWNFPSGATVDFEGIEYEKDLMKWQGTQMPLIIFDELTEFTKKMFFFMFSRNRGQCGFKPYIRASCNPDPDSWVAEFLSWWIDQETGYPIKERAGVLRYMINHKDRIIWGDSKEQIVKNYPDAFNDERFIASGINPYDLIKSVTFIPGDVYDNKILLANDPGYLGALNSMDEADQARFFKGNWKIRGDGMGLYDTNAIERIFTNEVDERIPVLVGYNRDVPVYMQPNDYRNNYITCDAAKFGRDLCVIMVWHGWQVVHITIFYQSTPHQIKEEIEVLRQQYKVVRQNTLIDQDGVGGDTVKLGRYYGFSARREVAIDPITKVRENYKMRKDQCYFHSADRVNNNGISILITTNNVKVYDKGSSKPRYGNWIMWNNERTEVSTIIKNQLRAIKRGPSSFDLGETKLCTNTKDEQKEILGCSPDFADTIMMREEFELIRKRSGGFKVY